MSAGRLHSLNFAERPGAYDELTPEQQTEYDLARTDPLAAAEQAGRRLADRVARLQADPESVIGPAQLPECDRWFFADEAGARDFYAATRDGVRQGVDGHRWEVVAQWLPWGFRLDTIPTRVHVWHREQDHLLRKTQLDFIVQRIPDCVLATWPDSGHIGLAKHWDQVLAALT